MKTASGTPRSHFIFAIALIRTYLHLQHLSLAYAIAIDTPTLTPQSIVTPKRNTYNQIKIASTQTISYMTSEFRIRKTKPDDIDAISNMLAMASMAENNWKQRITRLAIKSTLEKQLRHRLNAIEEGQRTLLEFKKDSSLYATNNSEECIIDPKTTCHLLWSNDNFRDKLKSAVMSSSERNAWEGHNFNYTPQDVALFNHVMMTVVQRGDNEDDNVVGFCEVAWLPRPSSHTNNVECSPSIVNLVTCPSHRRRGIASRLIDVASRYARTQWLDFNINSCNGIGLYVHPDNESALYLYGRKGFEILDGTENGLLYMSRSV
jgi:ribosomal protein S18 acetylase RimI-like enzyme